MQLIQKKKLQLPSIHAVIVGSDMSAQSKFESELRNFTRVKQIQNRVHFVNKTLAVAPYLAAIDVLVQNSQVSICHVLLILYRLLRGFLIFISLVFCLIR